MDNESPLMAAYVSIRADLSQLQKDTAKARQIVEYGLARPIRLNINSDALTKVSRAADEAAAKIKGIANADTSKLTRGINAVDHAFRLLAVSSRETVKSLEGVGKADFRQAENNVDRLTDKVRRLGDESRRAQKSSSSSSGLIIPGAGGGHQGYAAGGMLHSATGSLLGGLAARGIGGLAGGAMRGVVGAAMRSPAGLAAVGGTILGGTALAPVAGAYSKVAKEGLSGIADEKKYTRSFEILLKDARQAKELFSEMAKLNLEVPIDMTSLLKSTQELAQAGMTASEIPDRMKIILDAAAMSTEGVAEGTQRIVHMISKIKASGILEMEDLKSMARMGLPVGEVLEQQFGITIREVAEATRKGKLEIEAVLNAMFDGMETKFSGGIGKEIESITGQITLLQNKYQAFAGEIARPLFEPMLESLKEVNGYLESADAKNFTDMLIEINKEAVETAKTIAGLGEQIGMLDPKRRFQPEQVGGPQNEFDVAAKNFTSGVPLRSLPGDIMEAIPGALRTFRGGMLALAEENDATARWWHGESKPDIYPMTKAIQGENFDAYGQPQIIPPGLRPSRFESLTPLQRDSAFERAAKRAERTGGVLPEDREQAIREQLQFEWQERQQAKERGRVWSGAAGVLRDQGRSVISRGIDSIAEMTGLESPEQKKEREERQAEERRSRTYFGLTIPSADEIRSTFRGMDVSAQRADVRESVEQRKEREREEKARAERLKRESDQRAERLNLKNAQREAEETVRLAQNGLGAGFVDEIEDPRLREVFQNSQFAVRMKRNEDGEMAPDVYLKELFQQSRATSQTTSFGGLNAMMQSNIDAAYDKRFQEEQKKMLEKSLEYFEKQIELQEKIKEAVEKDAGIPDIATIAPG